MSDDKVPGRAPDRMPPTPIPPHEWRCGRCGRVNTQPCDEKGPPGWEARIGVMVNGGMMLCDECTAKEHEDVTAMSRRWLCSRCIATALGTDSLLPRGWGRLVGGLATCEACLPKEPAVLRPWKCSKCGRVYGGWHGEEGPPGWEARIGVMPDGGMMVCKECVEAEREAALRDIEKKLAAKEPTERSRRWVCTKCCTVETGSTDRLPPGWKRVDGRGSVTCDECLKKEREGLVVEAVGSAIQNDVTKGVLQCSASFKQLGDTVVTSGIPCDVTNAEEERALVIGIGLDESGYSKDILEPAGVDLGAFRENPVVFFHHRHDLPAIGKALWVRAVGGEGGSSRRLVAKIVFARTRLGNELYDMYSRGYMESWAVGFVPTVWSAREDGSTGVHVTEWELKEISALAVPGGAQHGAVYDSIQSGEITDPTLLRALQREELAEEMEPAPAMPTGRGVHHDTDKLRLDLIPPEADEAVADVLGRSAATGKYEERNWERGIAWMAIYASIQRHLLAWAKGEDTDPESGLPHLDHALTDTAFLVTYAKRGMVGFDDRPSSQGEEGSHETEEEV